MRLGADLESNGLLDTATTIHCIEIMDFDTGDQWGYGPGDIAKGVEHLMQASELIFHNGITFDLPLISKLYPDFSTDGITVTDTLVLSRLIRSDLKNDDFNQQWSEGGLPRRLHGSHSLKAWGYRLGVLKGEYGQQDTDWAEWSEEMQSYCRQDVTVTHALWQHLQPEKWSQKAIRFEHDIAELCNRIGQAGWTFDIDKAQTLYGKLSAEKIQLEHDLQTLFPPWIVETEFVPKRNNKTLGYVEGVPFIKQKEIVFNSRLPQAHRAVSADKVRLEAGRVHAQRRCKGGRICAGEASVPGSAAAGTFVHVAEKAGPTQRRQKRLAEAGR